MLLVSRAEWGARPPKSRQPLDRTVQRGTALHYSAADADEQAGHANCARRVRAIQDFHLDGRGWADIAYSYICCKHGYVFEGRGRGIRTAAQGTTSGNDAFHAVCFLGDDTANRDDVTDAGRAAIRDAIRWCNLWAGVSEVRPHSEFHATDCPGDQLRGWLAAGMPVTTDTKEVDMPLSDDDLGRIDSLVAKRVNAAVGMLIRGDDPDPATGDTHPDNLERIRKEIAGLVGAMYTDAQLEVLAERLAPLVAARVQIAGMPTYTGNLAGTVTLDPKAPA